MLPLKVVYQI